MRKLADYLTLSYRMEIVKDKDEGGYVVSFPELPGCITCGETIESAIVNARDAKRCWLETALENGYTIMTPSE
ncbi:MAG: type II toxin-antitoxin system HicB family antitoxin [Erysipelotrichales bacterium]|nr:type II toxin-antitoxin system HicB family antitoxin [Erysipelotrichales bacterium]